MIKTIIVDDHCLFADALKDILNQDEEIVVKGTALNGKEALRLCREYLPDIVLMDIKMPESDGLQATKAIRGSFPDIKIVMLTTFEDDDHIIEAFLNGACGYIVKDVKPEEFISAIKCIHKGFYVMHQSVHAFILTQIQKVAQKKHEKHSVELKPEDIEIIKLLSTGKSNKEISQLMNYSEGTIKNRISELIKKTGVNDRTHMVVYALKNDII